MPSITRRMWLVPGYDCTLVQPCKFGSESCTKKKGLGHGRHSAELWMSVLGHQAEVLFNVTTSWFPSTKTQLEVTTHGLLPFGNEVCWHTAWPQEGQTEEERRDPKPNTSCKDWGACYQLSTGTTYVRELTEMLVSEGSDAVFKWLENEYWKLVK